LGCIIIEEKDAPSAREFLKDGISKVWKGRQPPEHVHFNKVQSHSQRKALLNMLKGLNFTSSIIAIRKDALSSSARDGMKCPRMYNYLAKHILERISWFAADRGDTVHITFASRSESSWEEFEDYIKILRRQNSHQIKFCHIGAIKNVPAAKERLLQAADWITSGVACGLNCDGFEEVETCYTEILWGKFWIRRSKLWPYGIKVLPHDYERKKEKLFRKIDAWLEDPASII
jgi:uncharacterized protein DUF3800